LASPPPRVRWAIFAGLALAALALRLPSLGERPMHTDEAVNGYITGYLLEGEPYTYDPEDRHGPALYAFALPVARLAGKSSLADLTETTVRLGPVIAGTLTILLFGGLVRQIGFLPSLGAAVLFAVGPLSVYYHRYFIHEALFVGVTLGFLLALWRAVFGGGAVWGAWAGACAGLMLACKETAVLHYAAVGLTGFWLWFATRGNRKGALREPPVGGAKNAGRQIAWWRTVVAGCLVMAVVVIVLYTWGGRHWRGPADLVRAVPQFTARAGGQGHEKPLSYYLALIGGAWPGGIVVGLAIAGGVVACSSRLRSIALQNEFVSNDGGERSRDAGKEVQVGAGLAAGAWAVYGVSVALIYSLIPYKTPWLALNLWLPIAVLAGVGALAMFRFVPLAGARWLLVLAGVASLAALAGDSWFWSVSKPADEQNPYAYAHTSEDLLGLPERVREVTGSTHSRVAVVAADPWPLPWYLRQFPETGYWQPGNDPGPAEVYITSIEAAESIGTRITGWRPEFFGLRPNVLVLLWTNPENPAGSTAHE